MLHTAGIPLYGDAGHAGGYQLLDGYRTQLTGLTAKEAETLFLTGMRGPAESLGRGTVVAAIQLKLPSFGNTLSRRIRNVFEGWYTKTFSERHYHHIA
jgi:predicted DNA-binding transcriptional regulator YafY